MTQSKHGATTATTRGRPANPPASPLAAFIVERLQQRRLTRTELAARLKLSPSSLSRLLTGKTRWTRVAPLAIADALDLSGADLTHLLALCAQRGSSVRVPSSRPARSAPHSAAGRPALQAVSPIGMLLEPLLRERCVTRHALAQALGVKDSTVTRLMSGTHTSSYAISAQGISAALGLEGMTRRLFLQQALALGAFALASGQAAPTTRYHGFDLAQFDEELVGAQRLLDEGSPALALARFRELYHTILQAPFSRTHQAAAARRIDAALALGSAQEAALPWGAQRTGPAVQTYNHVDREILRRFPIAPFAHFYARLLERRAPLYREQGDYAESIRQFTFAIDLCMPYVDDLALLVTLYRTRAHVWAVQGREREWRRDIESASRVAGRLSGGARRRLEGLIVYSEAEGFKRLAGAISVHDRRRQRAYAQAALSSFTAAHAMTQDEGKSHHMLLDVSLAQAYVWLDADESARRAQAVRAKANVLYPALVRKIDLTIANAIAMSGR